MVFIKSGALNVNLYVYPRVHSEIQCNLMFRDYLRNSLDIHDAAKGVKILCVKQLIT